MSFFANIFGKAEPTAALNFEVQNDWFISDDDLQKLSNFLSRHPHLGLTNRRDPMDDQRVLTLSIAAAQLECKDLEIPPTLFLRARRVGMSVSLEQLVFFREKFFARRGPDPTVRLRFGADNPTAYETSFSTDKASLFFGSLDIFQKSLTTDLLRLHVVTEHGSPVLASFDMIGARPALEVFGHAILGADYAQIVKVHPEIMDHLMRGGPQYTLTKKKALAAVKFEPGPLDYTKGSALYEAAQAYAVARQASEICGIFPEGPTSPKPHMSWTFMLYNEVPRRIRDEMGPLKIFD